MRIVAKGYPEEVLSAKRLALLRGTILKKIDKILESPVSKFCSINLRAGVAVVTCEDEASLN